MYQTLPYLHSFHPVCLGHRGEGVIPEVLGQGSLVAGGWPVWGLKASWGGGGQVPLLVLYTLDWMGIRSVDCLPP